MKNLINPEIPLSEAISGINPDRILVLTDENVEKLVLSRIISENPILTDLPLLSLPSGDSNKSLTALTEIWNWLIANNASRKSLLINIGGGMISDIGGFAAATFKRGIPFINVTTTLLGAADASVGGKTGINFNGIKNAVGAFADPRASFVDYDAFSSLPRMQILSGYAEIVKISFISPEGNPDETYDLDEILASPATLEKLIGEAVACKLRIVSADPFEKGLRKILNFGHTAGHAFESLISKKQTPVPHGIAVAHGISVALILSHMKTGLDSSVISRYNSFLKSLYPGLILRCDDYPDLIGFMRADKKNSGESIMFTLLRSPGKPLPDVPVSRPDIETALDIYRDYVGI